MNLDPKELLVAALALTQQRVARREAALAAARLDHARIVARLADDCRLTQAEIAALLPGVSRQRIGQLVAQGRLAPALEDD
jgi:hypothetical protein